MKSKTPWTGKVISIQPRIRMMRFWDERSFIYVGYSLQIDGRIKDKDRVFSVGVSKSDHKKLQFRIGLVVRGESLKVKEKETQSVEYFKTAKVEIVEAPKAEEAAPPPWIGIPERLSVFRERGPRRLDEGVYETKCSTCYWGCRMAVEISLDPFKKSSRKNRIETFCYGPKSCALHEAGPRRIVPCKKDTSFEEPDCIDEQSTANRGPDD